MKKILPLLMLLAACSKSNDKPAAAPPQPKWIVVNNYYVSQTYVKQVKLNGKVIMSGISAGQVKVDSTDIPVGTLDIIVTGGGGGDYISTSGSSKTIPASGSAEQTFSFQISGYSLFIIKKD